MINLTQKQTSSLRWHFAGRDNFFFIPFFPILETTCIGTWLAKILTDYTLSFRIIKLSLSVEAAFWMIVIELGGSRSEEPNIMSSRSLDWGWQFCLWSNDEMRNYFCIMMKVHPSSNPLPSQAASWRRLNQWIIESCAPAPPGPCLAWWREKFSGLIVATFQWYLSNNSRTFFTIWWWVSAVSTVSSIRDRYPAAAEETLFSSSTYIPTLSELDS